MKLYNKHIVIVLLLWVISSFFMRLVAQTESKVLLLTQQKVFEAREQITLEFQTSENALLYCHSSYGNALVYPNLELGKGFYCLPEFLSEKKGSIDFDLIAQGEKWYSGSIQIINSTQETILESYIGPPSISAGTHDFTMMTVIPTDEYDNPLADGTKATIKHHFLETITNESVETKDFIFWKTIFSRESSGRLLVSANINEISSKEFSIEVFPAQPTNFTIDYTRKHHYADGNQITTFTTSVINDAYGNIISDGTLVEVVIKNAKGGILKAQGSTIKGIANIEVLHPDAPEIWEASAYVSGMATSNAITLEYHSITDQLSVVFSKQNRKITVGPLKSFMKQLVPDGVVVKLHILKNGVLLDTEVATSNKGMVTFVLHKGFYESGTYSFQLEALGIIKTYSNIEL